MKRLILLVVLVVLFADNLTGKLNPSEIEWAAVKSSVRWLNFYQGRSLLTFVVDEFPALRGLPPGGYYPPTKFPPGNFACCLVAPTSQQALGKMAIDVRDNVQYCLVTFGPPEKTPSTIFIPEAPITSSQRDSRITIYNMIPDTSLLWPVKNGELEVIAVGKARQATFTPHIGFAHTVRVTMKDGKKQVLSISIPPSTTAASWIAFCHDNAKDGRIAVSYIREGSTVYISGVADTGSVD
ncbi:MAG TPA: hypothetical protein VIT91_17945 [Chthoniobacterales bacterium]